METDQISLSHQEAKDAGMTKSLVRSLGDRLGMSEEGRKRFVKDWRRGTIETALFEIEEIANAEGEKDD